LQGGHHDGDSSKRPTDHATAPRAWRLLERKPLTVRRASQIIALATIAVTLGGGVLMHFGVRIGGLGQRSSARQGGSLPPSAISTYLGDVGRRHLV
jgi:hypothetical protein